MLVQSYHQESLGFLIGEGREDGKGRDLLSFISVSGTSTLNNHWEYTGGNLRLGGGRGVHYDIMNNIFEGLAYELTCN